MVTSVATTRTTEFTVIADWCGMYYDHILNKTVQKESGRNEVLGNSRSLLWIVEG